MGSSTSKPRKGHEKPKHLPKVGTPANRQWEQEGRQRQIFGPTPTIAAVAAVVIILAVIGLVFITA